MDQRIIDLYDEYTHAPLPRRVFLEGLAAMAGGAAAIPAILAAIEPNYARAAIVGEDDTRLAAEKISFQGATGDVSGYLARPKLIDKAPAVLVIHENRGLNAYVEDVTRRLATEGFVAMAPDLLSPLGGTPQDADKARDMIGQLDADKTVNNLVAAMSYLMAYRYSSAKVGAVGFCWGGGMVNRVAIAAGSALDAAVAYYGPAPDPAEAVKVRAPMLLHYAGLDTRVDATGAPWVAALKAAGKDVAAYTYPGVNHAFNNDTAADRYNADAAKLAWDRTVDFLHRHLDMPT